MGQGSASAQGYFSWTDLGCLDLPGARAFYSGLFGWTCQDRHDPAGRPYSIALTDDRPVAALRPASDAVRPGWISYITVDNLDSTMREATRAGGTVLSEPIPVFDSGRMAMIASPGGATVALREGGSLQGAGFAAGPGGPCGYELNTRVPEADEEFFARLFDWRYERVAKPRHTVIRNAGRFNGTIVDMRGRVPDQVPSFWNVYFAVKDADEIAAKARAAGGQIAVGPLDVPAGRFAVALDPDQTIFSIIARRTPGD